AEHRMPQKRSSNPYRLSKDSASVLPSSAAAAAAAAAAALDGPAPEEGDWESHFSKRYPTLAGLEMVETEINGKPAPSSTSPPPSQVGMKVRDA
ncbi:MAG: hypothetical protein Q9211_007128, partial [Gyalolechia sp. 1 TL-2023]